MSMVEDEKRRPKGADEGQSLLEGGVRLLTRPTHVEVTFLRSAQSVAEFETVRSAVEQSLRRGQLRKVLFDVTRADRSPDEVRDRIWSWITVSGPFDRVAFVTDNDMLRVTINMTGVKSAKALRAFADTGAATAWLAKA